MAYLSIWLLKNASAIMIEGVLKLLDLRRFLRKRRAITGASKIALKTPSPSQPGIGFVYLKVRAARPLGGLDATGQLPHLAVFSRVAVEAGSAIACLHRSPPQHVVRRYQTCSCPHTGVTMTRPLPHRHLGCPKWCAPRYTVPPSLVTARVLLVQRSAPSTHRPRRPGVATICTRCSSSPTPGLGVSSRAASVCARAGLGCLLRRLRLAVSSRAAALCCLATEFGDQPISMRLLASPSDARPRTPRALAVMDPCCA